MKICVVGNGNVGAHLFKAFREVNADVYVYSSRRIEVVPPDGDVYLVAVRDDAVSQIVSEIARLDFQKDVILAHTSGSVELTALKRSAGSNGKIKFGVFYPLQTFTKGQPMDYASLPFLIEGEEKETESVLLNLAEKISNRVTVADSKIRGDYHLGAVIACNFSNYLCGLADEYLRDNNLDFKMLLPLMRQMIEKLENITPAEAQTGPAVRGDESIVGAHLSKLDDYPEIKDIYSRISNNISNKRD